MKFSFLTISAAAAFVSAAPAAAQIVTYTGADNNVSSLAQMTNSTTASANFAAVTPGATTINFEIPIPASISISGGTVTSASCGSICGFNTSAVGSNFLYLFGGTTTISFTSPINSFGFYLTGLQSNLVSTQTVTFNDGSSQTFDILGANDGGGAFFGLTDFGRTISSFTFDATNDIVALDDLRFANVAQTGAVPEPATWAMMLMGFGGMGVALRRRKRPTQVIQMA